MIFLLLNYLGVCPPFAFLIAAASLIKSLPGSEY
jgi:hypothetical protein